MGTNVQDNKIKPHKNDTKYLRYDSLFQTHVRVEPYDKYTNLSPYGVTTYSSNLS